MIISTIHRYIFRDLLRVFTLATLVLSVVLGFGFMLRPLQQFSIDPARVPELMLYTLPITLSLVLPVSGLLATTLVFGRLAVDNEINACRSSGISILALVRPALVLAMIVGGVTLVLSFYVIPDFISRFENTLKSDAESMIFRNIQKKNNMGHYFGKMKFYADKADQDNNLLSGVAIIDPEKQDTILTARQVRLNFIDRAGSRFIRVDLFKPQGMRRGQDIGSVEMMSITLPLPDLIKDKIKFKKLDELKAIQEDMTRFASIRKKLQEVRRQYLVERFFEFCHLSVREKGFVEVSTRDEEWVKIFADQLLVENTAGDNEKRPEKLETAYLLSRTSERIEIVYYRDLNDTRPRKIEADQARLMVRSLESDLVMMEEEETVSIDIVLVNAVIMPGDVRQEFYSIPSIEVPASVAREQERLTLSEVLRDGVSLSTHEPSAYLQLLCRQLREGCQSLQVEIQVDKHSRLALGASCVMLVLMGAALGILFRSSHLLTAFGVGFIPAAVCMISISTGKQLAEQYPDDVLKGILFLWSGILVVVVCNVWLCNRLMRN